ncbi:MAG: hypothetical protein BZY83_01640 [SAR202 cluster bacterium Casp-Chloro-G2]|nr:MAG: hypothetical protein BZY83_01640 [SAR202 cluster bacterium Casp-Chloro-G2]
MYDSSTSPKPVIGLRDGLAQGQGVLQGGLLNNVVPVGESRAKTKEALTLIAKNHHKNHQGQVKGIKHILPIGNRRPARQVADL